MKVIKVYVLVDDYPAANLDQPAQVLGVWTTRAAAEAAITNAKWQTIHECQLEMPEDEDG